MPAERVWTRPLLIFLAVVAAVVLRGLVESHGPWSAGDVLQRLADGDLEGEERQALLRRVEAAAQGQEERGLRLAGAMAAVALGDEEAWVRHVRALGGGLPVRPDDVGFLDAAALGDPVLGALLQAMLAEARGEPDAAARYAQVEASSRLFHMPFARRLAAAGRERQKR
jgi:hypothetical protein